MASWLQHLTLALLIGCSLSEVVNTQLGAVKGWTRSSRGGRTYHGFTKIPYAKPPVGKLRLKNPEPAEPWTGTLDATQDSPMCLQVPVFFKSMRNVTFGQEDCLYLNVFTPDIKPKKPMSVMIYIHGGSLRMGHSGPKESMDYFMDEDVVLVSMEYRVGALGFMSTEDSNIPGNFGLKDQALAIKWTKDNIKNFGGDPDSLTIFGECAGGVSTHFHMASPLTKGLLKGIISESGVMNKMWAFGEKGFNKKNALKAAEIVGCPNSATSNSKSLLECLQAVDPAEIMKSEVKFLFWDYDPITVFRPTVEPEGEGAFMPENPWSVPWTLPWVTGIASSEGALKGASLLAQDKSEVEDFIKNMDEYLPKIIAFDDNSAEVKQSVEMIKKKYFSDRSWDKVFMGLMDMYGDLPYIFPMLQSVKMHKGDAYVYLFDYKGGSTLVEKFGAKQDLGVAHGDEVLSLFNWSGHFPKKNPGDEKMSKMMVKMWTEFAKNQKVSGWDKSVKGDYLHITENPKMKQNLKPEVLEFWESLPYYKSM